MATYIHKVGIFTFHWQRDLSKNWSKKSSTLLDQNLGPCVDCRRGRGLLIIVPVRCENWADLGKFWGNGQMPNICYGQNASFSVNAKRAGQIFLQMDLFGWDTDAHLATEEEKHATFVSHNIWPLGCGLRKRLVRIFKKFQDICKNMNCGKRVALVVTLTPPCLTHAKVTDYESSPHSPSLDPNAFWHQRAFVLPTLSVGVNVADIMTGGTCWYYNAKV